jgi:NNP family nitrate/nitrite transporter-like MFS transporter
MTLNEFRRAGHWPTLGCAFLYFDTSFMVWVLLGALANFFGHDFGLSDSEKGLLVAVPLLSGAVLRLVFGLATDAIGARRTGLIGMVLTAVPLLLGWLWVDSFASMLVVGALLGVAGASFAVALPLASRWYPPQYQGLALGIAGAGNSGTALATLFGPRLAEIEGIGWHGVFGLALIPLLLTLLLFAFCAKESPTAPPRKHLRDYIAVLRQRDAWYFCFFYAITFGGFVGLASFMSIFFHTRYEVSRVTAGLCATVCVLAGSCLRPLGGYLADRAGGIRLLTFLYVGVAVLLLDLATAPPLVWSMIVFVFIMALLGLGNGAVFQLVPQRFPKEIGVVTGIVGAAGGVGGFFLPVLFGGIRQATGSFSGGFLLLALVGFCGAVALVNVSQYWEGTFVLKGGVVATPDLTSATVDPLPATAHPKVEGVI